ncbi:hypothetical protein V1291_004838 [Nitrobacteraceae bacterium AZCC 1564]
MLPICIVIALYGAGVFALHDRAHIEIACIAAV